MTKTMQDLESLARERSSEKRRELLRAISDCFFGAQVHTSGEVALYDDVVGLVLDEVEPIARAELAERLADVLAPPPRLLRRLAEDEIEVAEPILSRSPALEDCDLERIAAGHSQAHLAAIAARPTLSERVTDMLVERGNEQVVETVAGNDGARFSQGGFARLADRAAANAAVLDRLGTRQDLPAEITARLVPLISEALAAKLKAVGASPDVATVEELAEQSQSVLAERLRAATKLARPLEMLVDHLRRGLIKLDEAVIELAEVDATPDVAKLIADRVELRSDTVLRAMCVPPEEPIALLCRGAGLRINGYAAIVLMRRRRRRGSDSPVEQVLERYQRIPLETAQRVLRFLKLRESAEAS
jgi:uncharacterized protein (DUF2336 family)